jgi:hypothetical protein
MKFPFTIVKKYKTLKTKDEINDIINSQGNEKLLYGLRIDKFYTEFKTNEFKIYRESFGVDFFLENYPLITSKIMSENPTKLEVEIKPNYFNIAFFGLFVVGFILGAIFLNEIEINGVLKNPNLLERLLFSLGGIIPGIWCYIAFIRPIYKTEKWFVEKLDLKEI